LAENSTQKNPKIKNKIEKIETSKIQFENISKNLKIPKISEIPKIGKFKKLKNF